MSACSQPLARDRSCSSRRKRRRRWNAIIRQAGVHAVGDGHGWAEGELNRLRLPYRVMLGEQGFDVHVSQLQLENVTRCMRCTRRMPNARSARVRAGADASRSQGQGMPAVRGVAGGSGRGPSSSPHLFRAGLLL